MENASKALLIAGGVLIAILLIALLVKMGDNVSSFAKKNITEKEIEQIEEFNKQYLKFVGQDVYGNEVRNLMNKYENDGEVNVILEEGSQEPPTGVGQETKYYKCTGVTFNEENGKIDTIKFKQIFISTKEEL